MNADGTLMLSQLSQLAAGLLAGCFGGCAFGVYQGLLRRGKRLRPHKAYLLPDALFAGGLILLWLAFWFGATDGSLRAEVLLWVCGGFAAYAFFLRPPLRRLVARLRPAGRKQKPKKSRVLYAAAERHAGAWADRGALAYCRFMDKAGAICRKAGMKVKKTVFNGKEKEDEPKKNNKK